MKNYKLYFKSIILLLSLSILITCNYEEEEANQLQQNAKKNLNKKNNLFEVGKLEKGKPILYYSLEKLGESLSQNMENKYSFESFSIQKANDQIDFLFIAKHKDLVTTARLFVINDLIFSNNISCTSKACATTKGCEPKKDKLECIGCYVGEKDCEKTISTEAILKPKIVE